MTNLEHIIENTLMLFERKTPSDEIMKEIILDPNYTEQPLNKNEIYEICQYIWCDYLDNGNALIKPATKPLKDANNDYICPRCKQKLEFARYHPHLIQHHCPCGQEIDWDGIRR